MKWQTGTGVMILKIFSPFLGENTDSFFCKKWRLVYLHARKTKILSPKVAENFSIITMTPGRWQKCRGMYIHTFLKNYYPMYLYPGWIRSHDP
jgi:hypothetical protein